MSASPELQNQSGKSYLEMWKTSGPAWMAAGLNIGGGTVTNSVLLAAATGFKFGWVFIFATFAIFMCTMACVQLTVVTGKNPITVMREHISPAVGWLVGSAIVIVNLVFATLQVVLGGLVLHTLFPMLSQTVWGITSVVIAAFIALVPGKAAMDVVQNMLKWMVYALTASFLVTLVFVDVDWSGFFSGLFLIELPTSKNAVLLFTAVLGSALAINVPTIQAFATRTSGWGPSRLANFRFETVMTNIFLFLVQLGVLIVVASTLFKAGITPKTAVQAATALEPLAGKFSTVLFCLGLFGAVLSTMVAESAVHAYTVSDIIGRKPEPGTKFFKILQTSLFVLMLTVPLFGWNPFSWVAWGAAFNSTFMPLGIAAWWYLMNKQEVVGKYRAGTWYNIGLGITFLIALAAAVRFWYVTLS
ncbi:NRAMP family divalent metal transporter [Anaeroselena agilis]|uniref:Divalent metal cation transporter n=1 Tax=Anaeroselena agilis TaxID=3063788 RepID=A0ABU3P355_9FIRM|nr:divalent metal cation transporter [Selenomonadales bacterium 4137-cl]